MLKNSELYLKIYYFCKMFLWKQNVLYIFNYIVIAFLFSQRNLAHFNTKTEAQNSDLRLD